MFRQISGFRARKSTWQCLGPEFGHPDHWRWSKTSSRLGKRHPWGLPRLPKSPGRFLWDTKICLRQPREPSRAFRVCWGGFYTSQTTAKNLFSRLPRLPQHQFLASRLVQWCLCWRQRVSVRDTHNLRPPYKLLKSVFVRHEIPVYNTQNWCLCWEHTMSVRSIHNPSTPHKVLKSVPVRHQNSPSNTQNMYWLPTRSFFAACTLLQSKKVLLSIINEIYCHPTKSAGISSSVSVPSSRQSFLLMDKSCRQKLDASCQPFQS